MFRFLLRMSALGVLALAIGVPGFVALNRTDLPAPGDTDLDVAALVVPSESDGFPHLENAARSLVWPGGGAERAAALQAGTEPWDAEWVAAALEQNFEAFGYLDHALRSAELAIPGEIHLSADEDLGFYLARLDLARLIALRSEQLRRSGDATAAADYALSVVELGHRLVRARGAALVDALGGTAIQTIGLEALERAAVDARLSATAARRLAKSLDRHRSDPDVWARIWAVEYRVMKQVLLEGLHELAAGEEPAGPLPASPISPDWLPESYSFHPRRTVAMYAEAFRDMRDQAGRVCARLETQAPAQPPKTPLHALAIGFSPNGAGKVLASVATPDFRRYAEKRCLFDTRLSAAQVRLALAGWRSEHDGLPESLDSLVPVYLAAVPPDGFDGAPLRYAPERGLVYSVGSDLFDAGGDTTAGAGELIEPTFAL